MNLVAVFALNTGVTRFFSFWLPKTLGSDISLPIKALYTVIVITIILICKVKFNAVSLAFEYA